MSGRKTLKEQLDELSQLVVVPPTPVTKTDDQEAKRAVADEGRFYADALHAETVADRKSARTQRETYARRIFTLVCAWIVLIFALLLFQGFGEVIHYKPLSDTVLITLISSTTVNVIGTLIIVLKYIFKVTGAPHRDSSSSPN
jgi:protein-S-isoprenylcysteine O-methyltransferase Ste14